MVQGKRLFMHCLNAFMIFEITWSLYRQGALAWLALGLVIFGVLQFKTAPYGRHTRHDWGPLISNRLGWVVMESIVLVVLWFWLWPARYHLSTPAWVMAGLFSFHYINRSFIFPFRTRTKGKKMPLVIAAMAVVFNLVNGSLFGIFFSRFETYDVTWFRDIRFHIGLGLFLIGLYINWRADHLLIHLRKPGETGYVIPRGWLFDYVSCPNLLGEMVEWLGFAILTWSLPGLVFFLWTCANLIPRAQAHHRWYHEHFPDYPKERKIFLPFIW